MKLIAKKGSPFEETLREMCEEISSAIVSAQDLVESYAGVRPKDVYSIYHWGIIFKLSPSFVFDINDTKRINTKCLRRMVGTKDVWIPALRYKDGRQLDDNFSDLAKQYTVREDPLNEYGIHMIDEANRISYSMQPGYDVDTNRYILYCSDSTPKGFDEKKLAKDQFDIEY